jgi:hypothetical protein
MTVHTQFVPRNYDVFGGLDVDKKSMAVIFTDHDQLKQALRLPVMQRCCSVMCASISPSSAWPLHMKPDPRVGLHDELVANVYRCLVVAPAIVPTAPGQRVKTNRLDERKLSENLRGGQLRSIHVPTTTYRELRHLVQLRDMHVSQLTATKCRIKALLLYEGLPFPGSGRWSAALPGVLSAHLCPSCKESGAAQSHRGG